MQVTTKITVDMTRQNVGQRVNAVQGDGNTRLVEITLLSGGVPWTLPEGVDAAIAYMQPGGTKGQYNLLADGSAAISINGNVATIVLAPQMLTVSGTVQASLVFNDTALNRLTTFPFAVSVTSNPAAGAQKVEDYLRLQWLEDKLDEYLRKAADSGEFDGKPGDNGVTFTPIVSENGDLSWHNNGSLPNPQTVNIRGPQGDSTAATAAANAAKTSAANAATHAADAATSAAEAQAAVVAMGTELSQIKDDLSNKLPKSPADWQEWTAEEQAAARGKMSVHAYHWQKIADVTITEEVNEVTLSSPEMLQCEEFVVRVILPKSTTGEKVSLDRAYVRLYGTYATNNTAGFSFNTTNVNASIAVYQVARILLIDNYIFAYGTEGAFGGAAVTATPTILIGDRYLKGNVSSISVSLNDITKSYQVGTQFLVYGRVKT